MRGERRVHRARRGAPRVGSRLSSAPVSQPKQAMGRACAIVAHAGERSTCARMRPEPRFEPVSAATQHEGRRGAPVEGVLSARCKGTRMSFRAQKGELSVPSDRLYSCGSQERAVEPFPCPAWIPVFMRVWGTLVFEPRPCPGLEPLYPRGSGTLPVSSIRAPRPGRERRAR
jgi:hypothetical protein